MQQHELFKLLNLGSGQRVWVVVQVIHAAGVKEPRAFVIVYTARARLVHSVHELHKAFPSAPIFCRALDAHHAAELRNAGASEIIDTNTEAGAALGSRLMSKFGAKASALDILTKAIRKQVSLQKLAIYALSFHRFWISASPITKHHD